MGYNPNQPRDPAGEPTGGQWTAAQLNTIDKAAREAAGLGLIKSDFKPSERDIIAMGSEGEKAIRKATGLDATINRDTETINIFHQVTGRQMGAIHVGSGRIEVVKDIFREKVSRAYRAITKATEIKNIKMRLDRLRYYPGKNSKRIKELEKYVSTGS